MTFNVGDSIDLSYLNKRSAAATFQGNLQETEQEVGTSYRFDKALKAFRNIPVVMA